MAFQFKCPNCGTYHRLHRPYPPSGSEFRCPCGRRLLVRYPAATPSAPGGPSDRLPPPPAFPPADPAARPKEPAPRPVSPHTPRPVPPSPRTGIGDFDDGITQAIDPSATPRSASGPTLPPPLSRLSQAAREAAPPVAETPAPPPRTRPDFDEPEPTFISMPPAGGVPLPDLPRPLAPSGEERPPPDLATSSLEDSFFRPEPQRERPHRPISPPPVWRQPPPREEPADRAPPPRRAGIFLRLLSLGIVLVVLVGLLGATGTGVAFWVYGQDLPSIDALKHYQPPTVTEVYDAKGRLMGEIYEKRRYVVPTERIPAHVQNAFLASEDANFRKHSGIDPMGIVRAALRNLKSGRIAQGASTITQQVAKNFLLTSEKKWSRKIKEVLLARRIEETFDKDRILYLYLNQIYLGSGAYGVEAASRIYFDKHVENLSLAEAAILAGLPQRPSEYSPIQDWQKARARQEYVLEQMVDKGFISRAEAREALDAPVDIVGGRNEFLSMAPYFTEHIRRYLVETYGFDKVYNDGLVVDSTCDLDLQKVAQKALVQRVTEADEKIGWRGPLEKLSGRAIEERLDRIETELREAEARSALRVAAAGSSRGGHDPLPARSTLKAGETYDAVVLDVVEKHAVVGIGAHRGLIPLAWTTWAYKPNPRASWKGRRATNLTTALSRGDVVRVKVENTDFRQEKVFSGYTAAGSGPFAALRLHQDPELEGAFLAYRLDDGAVVAMVGGVDFEKTEFNRATQAQRQVGSTFKPIVYAAAIATRQITAGTLIQDAPVVYNALEQTLWKPGNYGEDYLGNITLRKALQLSRNVCTVRVLDRVGLEVVYQLAGPALRIGYPRPTCHRIHIPLDQECNGESQPSPVQGMQWCSWCDPESCPLIQVREGLACMSEPVQDAQGAWCRSCDIVLRVCDYLSQSKLPEGDRCADARKDDKGNVFCRACDLSMGLGSSSLTMVELVRAYSAFATYGRLVDPHWIQRVVDRDGTVIEGYKAPAEWPRVMEPGAAAITHWLLQEVARGGTAAKSNQLGIAVAGKTGTTNDFLDAWFVGYNPDIIAGAWMGFDQPRTMGQSFTGGEIALPLWMDFFRAAVPRSRDRSFPPLPGVVSVPIDESTGRVARGGTGMPMLPGTAPEGLVGEVGQKTTADLLNMDF